MPHLPILSKCSRCTIRATPTDAQVRDPWHAVDCAGLDLKHASGANRVDGLCVQSVTLHL